MERKEPSPEEQTGPISDVDVADADIATRIRRCEERIAQGTCVKGYQLELEALLEGQKIQEQVFIDVNLTDEMYLKLVLTLHNLLESFWLPIQG